MDTGSNIYVGKVKEKEKELTFYNGNLTWCH